MSAPAALPASLQRWQDWLGWFDLSLAKAVGELVRRLQDLTGPASAQSGREAREPDGLGDLRSRGPYERLLATEWLLADELPEEFLRRAASSEHLFLAPSLKTQPSDRMVIALFDAGPRQLGGPRVAQLAAWVLLARRAAELGGDLRWGIVQQPGFLRDASSVEELGRLMRARRFDPVTDAHRAAWREVLIGDPDETAAELWWIGAPGADVAAPSGRERALTLRLSLREGELDAQLSAPGASRRASLPLPDGRASARLLRGDFKTVAAAPTARKGGKRAPPRGHSPAMAMTHEPLFARGGGSVMVPAVEGANAALVFTVPELGAKHQVKRRERQWSSRAQPLAIGVEGLRAFGLAQRTGATTLVGWELQPFSDRELRRGEEFSHVPGTARWLPLILLSEGQNHELLIVDAERRLSQWPQGLRPHEPVMRVIGTEVLAMVPVSPIRALILNYRKDQLWLWEVALGPIGRNGRAVMALADRPDRVFLAQAVPKGPKQAPLPVAFAARTAKKPAETWRVRWSSAMRDLMEAPEPGEIQEATLHLAPQARAVGLTAPRHGEGDGAMPALIVISAGRRSLLRVTAMGNLPLFSCDADIVKASVCPMSARVALLTRERELMVLDGHNGDLLMTASDGLEKRS